MEVSLSTYAALVEKGGWCFPSYWKECAICGGQNCAVRCGYYRRQVVILFSIVEILVARYRCRRKGRAVKGAHRTFSLLPQEVHPYQRYSSTAGYEVLKETMASSLTATLFAFLEALKDLSMSTIYRIRKLFRGAVSRLMEVGDLEEIPDDWQQPLIGKIESFATGIIGIKQDYYKRHGRFLLGTPSQLR